MAPHKAQKVDVWGKNLFLRHLILEDILRCMSNSQKMRCLVRSPVRGTSHICMVLHYIMRCLILCHSLQEQNKTKNEVPHDSIKNVASP